MTYKSRHERYKTVLKSLESNHDHELRDDCAWAIKKISEEVEWSSPGDGLSRNLLRNLHTAHVSPEGPINEVFVEKEDIDRFRELAQRLHNDYAFDDKAYIKAHDTIISTNLPSTSLGDEYLASCARLSPSDKEKNPRYTSNIIADVIGLPMRLGELVIVLFITYGIHKIVGLGMEWNGIPS
jgi:hypothetical protein